MRDALHGMTRFDEFQKSLGIAPNMLTRRLNALVEAGLLDAAATANTRRATSTCRPSAGVISDLCFSRCSPGATGTSRLKVQASFSSIARPALPSIPSLPIPPPVSPSTNWIMRWYPVPPPMAASWKNIRLLPKLRQRANARRAGEGLAQHRDRRSDEQANEAPVN